MSPKKYVQTHSILSALKMAMQKRFVENSSGFFSDVVDFFGRAPVDMALTIPLVNFIKFVSFEKIFLTSKR